MSLPGSDRNLILRVLGTTTVEVDGAVRACGSRERTFLAAVAFGHPRAVTVDAVADALWPDGHPRTYRQSVHNLVSSLRRTLGADSIVTEPGPAYGLGAAWTIDVEAFASALDRARRARERRDERADRVHLQTALAWCRGEAYADLPDDTSVMGRRAAHLQAVLTAEEDAIFAELDSGDHLAAVGRATGLVAAEPYREVRWSLLALAAYRADQRGAALATLARARTVLRDDLGLEPGPALVRLERSVLDDDPRLLTGSSRAALGTAEPTAGFESPLTPAGSDDGIDDIDDTAFRSLIDGGGDDPLAAIDAMCAAAQSAAEAGLFTDAAALLASAVTVSERSFGHDDERTLHLLLRSAEQRRHAGDASYPEALWEVMHRADRSGAETPHALATAALFKLGPLTASGGQVDASLISALERALARCPDPVVRARCAGEATLYFSMKGEADRCRAYFDEALTLAREVGDIDLLISALGNAYLCLNHPDDLRQRADLAGEMLALAERLARADAVLEALHFVFAVQVQQADPMLRTTLAREVAMATTIGSVARRWMAGYQQTCVRFLEGRLDEAEAMAMRTLEIAPVAPDRAQGTYLMSLLNIREAQGREQELAADIELAVAAHPGMPAWRTIVAWLAARRGDADQVRVECDAVDAGRALPPDLAWSGATMLLGRAVALIGDVERSRRVYDLIAPYAGQFTWISSTTTGPYDLALAELALVIGDRAAASRHVDGLARCIDRTGAAVYLSDLERLRSLLG